MLVDKKRYMLRMEEDALRDKYCLQCTKSFCAFCDTEVEDAVEVVRCKDCKHYYFAENRVPEEQSWVCDVWHVNQTAHMGYCFKAERRTDE